MLQQLIINNLAIIEKVDLQFNNGLTVLTGETGAGKSILINALGLILGDRADPKMIATNQSQATISAIYNVSKLSKAKEWLDNKDLAQENDCVIRRIIKSDGKSRAYINDNPVNIATLKELANFLVNIHSQHQHQVLLNNNNQLDLLDAYAAHTDLLTQVQQDYNIWHNLSKQKQALSNQQTEQDKLTLIKYQLKELEQLDLKSDELEQLNIEHKQLSNAEQTITNYNTANSLLQVDNLHEAIKLVDNKEIATMLESAIININESQNELKNIVGKIEINDARLIEVEQRLSNIYDIARKHNVMPENLINHYDQLKETCFQLENAAKIMQQLDIKIDQSIKQYHKNALVLSKNRKAAALKLESLIVEQMQSLAMPKATFKINFSQSTEKPIYSGMDKIEFLVATNPGQSLQPLKKTASGGELSRISLAIEVIIGSKTIMPSFVFDEVDVGISGNTATIVGKLLKSLASTSQVLCITHLPQVAVFADQHFNISKKQSRDNTVVNVKQLDTTAKTAEIARLLGTSKITNEALAHANNMLAEAHSD